MKVPLNAGFTPKGGRHKIKGKYMVYKVFRHSARKQVLRINLTRDEAQRVVRQYKDSSRSMVVFTAQ